MHGIIVYLCTEGVDMSRLNDDLDFWHGLKYGIPAALIIWGLIGVFVWWVL
jgi:hypothetical protein